MKKNHLKFKVEITKLQASAIIEYLADNGKDAYISEFEFNQLKNNMVELIITREFVIKNEVKHFNRDIVDLFWYSGRRQAD